MGEEKTPVMTRLGKTNLEWVDAQVPLLHSRSHVVDLALTLLRGCIAAGIVKWEIPWLQGLLRNSSEESVVEELRVPGLRRAVRERRKPARPRVLLSRRTAIQTSAMVRAWSTSFPARGLMSCAIVTR